VFVKDTVLEGVAVLVREIEAVEDCEATEVLEAVFVKETVLVGVAVFVSEGQDVGELELE